MIKSVLALVFLLHCFCSAEPDYNLNSDIKKRLEELDVLYKQGKASITSAGPLRVPGPEMRKHAPSCVGNFTRELKHLLNDVSVSEDDKNLLQELKVSVQALDPHEQIGHKCGMTAARNVTTIFKNYINFLKKLNNSKRR